MVNKLLVAALLLIGAGMAYGKAQGGPIADTLYSNSLYGMAYPLTNGFRFPVNYALTNRAFMKRQSHDGRVGTTLNAIIPGLGSAVIGDPHAGWIGLGFYGSLLVAFGSLVAEFGTGINAGFSGSSPPKTPLLVMYASMGSLIGFYIWGLFSPQHYVETQRYRQRIQR